MVMGQFLGVRGISSPTKVPILTLLYSSRSYTSLFLPLYNFPIHQGEFPLLKLVKIVGFGCLILLSTYVAYMYLLILTFSFLLRQYQSIDYLPLLFCLKFLQVNRWLFHFFTKSVLSSYLQVLSSTFIFLLLLWMTCKFHSEIQLFMFPFLSIKYDLFGLFVVELIYQF